MARTPPDNGLPGTTRTAIAALLIALLGCSEDPTPDAPGAPRSTAAAAPAAESAVATPAVSNGKRPVTVTEGTNLSFALSPDGRTMVLSIQGVLFSLPANGGTATALTSYYYDAREPAWSPDGGQIVFHGYRNGNWDLWTLPATGGDPLPLTSDQFDDREPQYAPGGSQIAFASDRSGNYDIWLLSLADGSLTQLTHSPEDEFGPAWSPDGAQIAYAAVTGPGRGEARRVEVATGIGATLIEEAGTIAGIAWRADGGAISYQRAAPGITELKAVTLADGGAVVLSRPDDDVFPFRATWLDSDATLYAANGTINRREADGNLDRIPFAATFELERPDYPRRRRNHDDHSPRRALGLSQPAISEDGSRITFTALGDLWLWEPASGSLENLTASPFAERSPVFSPDGKRIAYVSDAPRVGSGGSTALWIYDLAQKRHTALDLPTAGVVNPAWSPDGRSVAVFTGIPGSPLASQLSIANLEDGTLTPVHRPVPAQGISWSADGAYVATTELAPYSSRYREGVYRLIVAAPGRDERYEVLPVAHKNMTSASLTPFGQAMTYVQDGQLWKQNLSETFQPQGYPEPLTAGLTDTPSWSSGGDYLVFMSGAKMMRLNVDTGETVDVTPEITWKPALIPAAWSIRIGRLFDGTGEGYLDNALITIQGNRIVSVEANALDATPDVDASDKAAFPGLFEMHAHLGDLSESQGRAWLAWGITGVRDPGAHPYVAKERQEVWDSGVSPGPRSYTTGYLADGNRVYYSIAEGIASDVHLDRALERAGKLGLDFIKTYVRLPDHRQKRVVEFAHGLGIPVSSHELFPAVAHGVDHVEHISGTSRRGYQPKVSALGRSYDDVVRLLAESGMGITPTVVLPGYSVIASEQPDLFETPQFQHFYGAAGRQAATLLVRMFGGAAEATAEGNGRLLKALAAADALLVTGTDAPFVPYGAGLHAELRLYARAGLTPAQVLKAATVSSARAAGVENDIGTIAPGMIADLVVVDGDPLADIADADNVVMTIKHGRAYLIARLLESPPAQ